MDILTLMAGTINNSDSLIFSTSNSGEYTGTLENTGYVYFPKGITGGNGFNGILKNYGIINFNAGVSPLKGSLENTGYINFGGGISGTDGLSATVNNYGYIKVNGGITIGANTYLTNDSTLEISNSDLAFQGPVLTNNGRISINGNFSINAGGQSQEAVNNGIIVVSGGFSMVYSNSRFINNCRFVCGGEIYMGKQNTTIENNGLLWTATGLRITAGNTAKFKNGKYGFVRGVNFESNQGNVSGLGKFYFTGTTYQNGLFKGDSTNQPIQFYATQVTAPGAIFSTIYSSISNVVRPASMTPLDTTGANLFDCSLIPPTAAGFPPQVKDTTISICSGGAPITLPLLTNGMVKPYDNTYNIDINSLTLYSSNAPQPYTTLTVAGKGTFVANTLNGNIVFTPAAAFTSGTVIARYTMTDHKGSATAQKSIPGKITINITPVPAPVLNHSGTGF